MQEPSVKGTSNNPFTGKSAAIAPILCCPFSRYFQNIAQKFASAGINFARFSYRKRINRGALNCEINSITYFTCNSEKRVLCPYYADANSVKALVSELQTEQDTITTQWIIRATNRFGFKDSLEVTSVVIPRSCNH